MSAAICRPCIGLGCDNPDDLAAGVDTAIYSTQDFSFIVQCPPKCFCPPGLFPQTISILASVIPPVLVPINEGPGTTLILRLQGCISLITRTLDASSTQSQIAAAAQSMFAEWAGQQANCIALLEPGVSCATMIDICNDAIVFPCFTGDVTIPAGIYCQKLATDGLTPSQIASQTAAIKAALNNQAIAANCPGAGLICQITYTPTILLGFSSVAIFIHNVSAVTKDLSPFQLCVYGGVPDPTCYPPFGPPATSIAPSSTILWASSASPLPTSFDLFYASQVIAHAGVIPIGHGFQVDVTIGCNG